METSTVAVDLGKAQVQAGVPVRACRHCGHGMLAGEVRCSSCGKKQQGRRKKAASVPDTVSDGTDTASVAASILAAEGVAQDAGKASVAAPEASTEPEPEAAPEMSEEEIRRIEDALADSFGFLAEDVAAPMLLPEGVKPPAFGDERARRLAAVWAPILAPYVKDGENVAMILAGAVTARAVGSYYREIQRAASA